ncbi:Helix-turn-helix domain protein [Streptomyces sp. ADI96-02]|uniref:helix-turn-helix domain-containing protein n=1 Tax=Streptomyces sp. ADI96-02 TaxID=1522760 RepID=UPI000FBC348F|nr:helix-turn-helix transcriptional regulator [Streptomyces sp. ADI96-02]RPK62939.1 Helix-turn-helix domain protein [Streptomyces sp. ADI96-02]
MTENLTIGERVAWYRRRRGLSQEVLAGLVGRTTDWLSKAENNRIELDRLSVITSLAEALDVSLGDLLSEPTLMEWSNDSGRRTVPALREALMDYKQLTPLLGPPPDDEPPTLEDLRVNVKEALDAYQVSRYGYATRRLPLVLADALTASRVYSGDEGREAYA